MAPNTPISVSPSPIWKVEPASPVSIEAAPMPVKNTTIMPRRLQRSASQPAGSEHAPNMINPPSDSGSISLYERPNSGVIASTTVGKISMNKWSKA